MTQNGQMRLARLIQKQAKGGPVRISKTTQMGKSTLLDLLGPYRPAMKEMLPQIKKEEGDK